MKAVLRLLAFGLLFPGLAPAAPIYRAQDVEFVAETLDSFPVDLNDLGQVAAFGTDGSERTIGFVWSPVHGITQILPVGDHPDVQPVSINIHGMVVGISHSGKLGSPGRRTEPFVWDAVNGFRSIMIEGGNKYGYKDLAQLTDEGEVVGNIFWRSDSQRLIERPFVAAADKGLSLIRSKFSKQILEANASRMNAKGQIAGSWIRPGCSSQAMRFDRTTGLPTLLGVLGDPHPSGCAKSSVAHGINSQGEVVGESQWPDRRTYTAFIWSDAAGMTALDGPATADGTAFNARDINDASQVVGTYSAKDLGGPLRYFYWDANTGLLPLESLLDRSDPGTAHVALVANGRPRINNKGQILVSGYLTNDTSPHFYRAFVLTPVAP